MQENFKPSLSPLSSRHHPTILWVALAVTAMHLALLGIGQYWNPSAPKPKERTKVIVQTIKLDSPKGSPTQSRAVPPSPPPATPKAPTQTAKPMPKADIPKPIEAPPQEEIAAREEIVPPKEDPLPKPEKPMVKEEPIAETQEETAPTPPPAAKKPPPAPAPAKKETKPQSKPTPLKPAVKETKKPAAKAPTPVKKPAETTTKPTKTESVKPKPTPEADSKKQKEKADAEKKKQLEKAETERKKQQEKAEIEKKRLQEAAAEKQRQREIAAAEEEARQVEQALLSKAKENLAKMGETRDKISASPSISLDATALPKELGTLQVDALPINGLGNSGDWGAKEASYSGEVATRLKKGLRLPDYGAVKIKLTLDRTGKVVKVEILSSESSKNKAYVESKIPTLLFPPFGQRFKEAAQNSFVITLQNDS